VDIISHNTTNSSLVAQFVHPSGRTMLCWWRDVVWHWRDSDSQPDSSGSAIFNQTKHNGTSI